MFFKLVVIPITIFDYDIYCIIVSIISIVSVMYRSMTLSHKK